MRILVNASAMKAGGGVQVADSICRELYRFPQHQFLVVLSSRLEATSKAISKYPNVNIERYTSRNTLKGLLTHRDAFLDLLVKKHKIDIVLFVFGPSLWYPRVPTVSGFAMSHLLLDDSPFWRICPWQRKMKIRFRNWFQRRSFAQLSECYYTENEFISHKLRQLFPTKKVETITNNYNQVFDHPSQWSRKITLLPFDGLTLLTVSSLYPHKNLGIIRPILQLLRNKWPKVNVRFVLTLTPDEFGPLNDYEKQHIEFLGRVGIEECPNLYRQADVMFLPTLLECFSASYAEAMRMGTAILTTDLGFARSLCGDAAEYFSPVDVEDAADKIALLYHSPQRRRELTMAGEEQIKKFDTFSLRADKIISLLEGEYQRQKQKSV